MINVTIGESKPQEEKPFPKLMEDNNGEIFYMVRERYGLPITGISWSFFQKDFADFSQNARTFTDYNEPITIQNA
jgi:hypothetical protein